MSTDRTTHDGQRFAKSSDDLVYSPDNGGERLTSAEAEAWRDEVYAKLRRLERDIFGHEFVAGTP